MTGGSGLHLEKDLYWYDATDRTALEVLEALRRHRAAESAMRRRMRDDMDMGDTDLAAIRWLIREERAGRAASSARLSRELGITTAATVKMVNRLIEGGYLARSRHASDRRVLLLRPLPAAHERVRHALGTMHARMMQLAESLLPAERQTIIRFLDDLVTVIDSAPNRGASGAGGASGADTAVESD